MFVFFCVYTIACVLIWVLDLTSTLYPVILAGAIISLVLVVTTQFYKQQSVLNEIIIFNIIGFLYTNFVFIVYGNHIGNQELNCMLLSSLCISSFNMAYFSPIGNNALVRHKTLETYNYKMINKCAVVLLLIGLTIEYYFIIKNVGLSSYIALTRAGRSLLMQESFYLANFYKPILLLAFFLSFISYFNTKSPISKYTAIISFFVCGLNSIVSVSRAELLGIMIPIVYILYSYKKITNNQVIISVSFLLLCMSMWKYWMTTGFTISYEAIYVYGEFGSWLRIGSNILNDINQERIDYLFGRSYYEAFVNFFIPFAGFEPLSKWYVKNYEYQVFINGGGRGFSGVIEAFMNFDILGCIFVYMIYGYVFKKIFRLNKTNKNILIQAVFISVIFKLFRSEAYSLWKNVWWLQVLPLITIFELTKKKDRHYEK